VFCRLVVLVRLSVPVQVIDWKYSSPKWPIFVDGDIKPYSLTHSPTEHSSINFSHTLLFLILSVCQFVMYVKLPDVQQLNAANHLHCHLSCHGPGLGWIIPWCCWSADLEQVAIFHVFEDIGYFKRLLKTLSFGWDCSTQWLAFRHTRTLF